MKAILTYPNLHLLSIIISVMTAILIFTIVQDTANATVPIPSQTFALASGHDDPRGMWGYQNTLWVVENDQPNNQQRIVTYNAVTGQRLLNGEFYLSGDNIKLQGIWSDGTVM